MTLEAILAWFSAQNFGQNCSLLEPFLTKLSKYRQNTRRNGQIWLKLATTQLPRPEADLWLPLVKISDFSRTPLMDTRPKSLIFTRGSHESVRKAGLKTYPWDRLLSVAEVLHRAKNSAPLHCLILGHFWPKIKQCSGAEFLARCALKPDFSQKSDPCRS